MVEMIPASSVKNIVFALLLQGKDNSYDSLSEQEREDLNREVEHVVQPLLGENSSRNKLLECIEKERERQLNLPGTEWDQKNKPNDWITIVNHYLSEECQRHAIKPQKEDFQDSFIKAGAVILAALENIDNMVNEGYLNDK